MSAGTGTDTQARRQFAERLARDASGYEFVQLVRLLSRLYPDRSAIGGYASPHAEVLRLSVPPSLAFPPSEIAGVVLPDEANADQPVRVDVRFLGLTGPQGVLPHVYTQYAGTRARAKDRAFRDFLDLFHHRVLSLFYRAWERHRPMVAAERGESDRLKGHLLDLVGAGTAGVQAQAGVTLDALAGYAGLLGLRSRPADGLAHLIADHFGVAVTVEQFVGEWRSLPGDGQVCLDDDGPDGRLGGAVIGREVYDPHARVRLRIGPLTREQFNAFLPGGDSHDALRRLAALYADNQVGVEAQLLVARADVPRAALGTADAPRLGFGTWIRSKPFLHDADDVRLALC